MRITARWKVHRRDKIILDELCESGNFLILLLHYFDVLCKLNNTLTIGLETKLSDDRELNLSAEGEHNLLVSDHAVTGLLLCQTYSCQVRRSLES